MVRGYGLGLGLGVVSEGAAKKEGGKVGWV
jgi:hypothetical protein